MSNAIVLGDFLRKRRSALDHESVGLPSYGQRRVAGLRREELALLAGISTSYYTRIEQGAVTGVSASVLDAIALALRLDADDRSHLYRLAGLVPAASTTHPGASLHPRVELLVRSIDRLPVGVLGRDMQMLAWNRACHQIFADHIPYEAPWTGALNWARLLFLDPRVRERFVDWTAVAMDITGRLRTSQARHPEDRALADVVDRLRAESTEFSRLWSEHPVRDLPLGGVVIAHPSLGELHLEDVVLRPTDDDAQLVIVFVTEPGGTTERVLRDLHRNLRR